MFDRYGFIGSKDRMSLQGISPRLVDAYVWQWPTSPKVLDKQVEQPTPRFPVRLVLLDCFPR